MHVHAQLHMPFNKRHKSSSVSLFLCSAPFFLTLTSRRSAVEPVSNITLFTLKHVKIVLPVRLSGILTVVRLVRAFQSFSKDFCIGMAACFFRGKLSHWHPAHQRLFRTLCLSPNRHLFVCMQSSYEITYRVHNIHVNVLSRGENS